MSSYQFALVFLWAIPARGPTFSQSIVLRARMLRSSLFDRLVVWIFCRGTIAVFAEKRKFLSSYVGKKQIKKIFVTSWLLN